MPDAEGCHRLLIAGPAPVENPDLVPGMIRRAQQSLRAERASQISLLRSPNAPIRRVSQALRTGRRLSKEAAHGLGRPSSRPDRPIGSELDSHIGTLCQYVVNLYLAHHVDELKIFIDNGLRGSS